MKEYTGYVNPFIGTGGHGHTHPGAMLPHGMIQPGPDTRIDGWDSCSGYYYEDSTINGFAHTRLSGTGCADFGDFLLMPTVGEQKVEYLGKESQQRPFASAFSHRNEYAEPGYYSVFLDTYGVKAELTATERAAMHRYTFPESKESGFILDMDYNIQQQTNQVMEVEAVNDTVLCGYKRSAYWAWQQDLYFYAVFSKPFTHTLYTDTIEEGGQQIPVCKMLLRFDTAEDEQVMVRFSISSVDGEGARQNLLAELPDWDFDKVRADARKTWNDCLSKIEVKTEDPDQLAIFYTAMYHLLIHPNIIQDVNGEYPMMESLKVGHTDGNRYTVFSLWDTYRNVSTLMTLLYPEKQLDIIRTMIDMYKESGWLPKWELYGRETLTMEGDPSIPYIVDAYMRGLRDYDIETAYEGMRKGATTPGEFNLLRPDNNDYMSKGYVPLREQYDNSVSHALEYYIADWNLSLLADALGKKEDAKLFRERAMGYKHYYCKEFGTLRPILPDGTFYSPFDPKQGENFEPSPGFHEGNAWNYTFYVPHDIKGLAKLMGGQKKFVDKLQMVFDKGYYDMANEPDIAYPYLFSYFKGEAWRTQKLVRELLGKYYHNAPNGLPGNDDTGTMSTWAIFSMMGFYPACPGDLDYVVTSPTFNKVTIRLDEKFYPKGELVIESARKTPEDIYIKEVTAGGKKLKGYTISQDELVNAGTLRFTLENKH